MSTRIRAQRTYNIVGGHYVMEESHILIKINEKAGYFTLDTPFDYHDNSRQFELPQNVNILEDVLESLGHSVEIIYEGEDEEFEDINSEEQEYHRYGITEQEDFED